MGGKATAAEVGTVCGLYQFSKKEKSAYVVNGFAKEFAEKLQAESKTEPLHTTEGVHYLPYDVDAFKNICAELIRIHKIKVQYNAVLKDVTLEEHTIKGYTWLLE